MSDKPRLSRRMGALMLWFIISCFLFLSCVICLGIFYALVNIVGPTENTYFEEFVMLMRSFITGPIHYFVIALLVVYTTRWIHYKAEKSRLDYNNIQGEFNNLLTLLNLEGKAQKNRSGLGFAILEDDATMDDVLATEDGNTDISGKTEYSKPFISKKFCLSYTNVSSKFFRRMEGTSVGNEEEDDSEAKVEDKEDKSFSFPVIALFLLAKELVVCVISILGSISDYLSLMSWFVFMLADTQRGAVGDLDYLSWLHNSFYFFSISSIILLGCHVAVIATIFNYYAYFKGLYEARKRERRSDTETEPQREDDFVKLDGYHESELLEFKEKFLIFLGTFLLLPLLLLGRLINIDILIHLLIELLIFFGKFSGKSHNFERVYYQQMFFWNVGKSLPMMFIQTISITSTILEFIARYNGEIVVGSSHVWGYISIAFSCASLLTSFASAVQSTLFWNTEHYAIRETITKINFILLQGFCLLFRLSSLLCIVLLIAMASYLVDIDVRGLIDYCGFFFVFVVLLSFFVRFCAFAVVKTVHSIKVARLMYAPLYAIQIDIFFEAFAGVFGGIINANPNSVFILQIVINMLEFATTYTVFIFVSFALALNLDLGDMSSSSSESESGGIELLPIFHWMLVLTNWIFNVTGYAYIGTAIMHVILFPMNRTKAMSYYE